MNDNYKSFNEIAKEFAVSIGSNTDDVDRAVWAACPQVKNWSEGESFKGNKRIKKTCEKCPSETEDGCQQMCRSAAEEIVKPALVAFGRCDDK